MKARLDHVGIAVSDLDAALTFYRDALGLDVEPPEEVASQRVRTHCLRAGDGALELLEATTPDSPIARFIDTRGPGLHHITLLVDDVAAALAQVKARGARLIDETPRPGAAGSRIAFIHPASAHGVLVELKQAGPRFESRQARVPSQAPLSSRLTLGDLELVSLTDGFFRLDGGSMFGIVPKPLWERRAPPDERNRITLAMRSLLVRGARTMLVDAGAGGKLDPKRADIYGLHGANRLDDSLASAGLSAADIDIVLATHLHFDHVGGFTVRDEDGRVRPRFPRAQYVARRGEWDDAVSPNERTRGSYRPEDFLPLAEARALQLVDEDATIMPGVRVRRTGGHTMHHQIVLIESGGKTAAFVADLIPTTAHVQEVWIMGYDLYPLDTLAFKRAFLREAAANEYLVFFEHDPAVAAGYIRERDGKWAVEAAL